MIEILDQRRAVMLLDEREDAGRQVVFLGQLHAVLHVADDDQQRDARRQIDVAVLRRRPGSR